MGQQCQAVRPREMLRCVLFALLSVGAALAASPSVPVAGHALSFDGSRDYVLVPVKDTDVTDIKGSAAFTMEAWVKPAKGRSGGCVFSKSNEEVASEYAVNVGAGGIVGFHRETESPNMYSSRRIHFGQWTHIAVTYDGREARIYLNGTHAGKKRQGPLAPQTKKVPFLVGALYYKGKPSGFFNGVIDDVRIWNVARSNVEIFRDMNRTLTGTESGLVADWKFDEGSGATSSDTVSAATGKDSATARLGDGIMEDRPVWILSSSPQGKICPNFCSGHGTCHKHVCGCESGWKGDACNTPDCPEANTTIDGVMGPSMRCAGRGKCIKGKCICPPGWHGAACHISDCPNACHNRGKCDVDTAMCECNSGWAGADCSLKACPKSCSGNGVCKNGTCVCRRGYKGAACDAAICPGKIECSGHGECNKGICKCDVTYIGEDCGVPSCPHHCSGHGGCRKDRAGLKQGICNCEPGWVGSGCEKETCPKRCSGHGRCYNGECSCDKGWGTETCGIKICPKNCSGNGACVNGVCQCDARHSGVACDVETPCPGEPMCTGHGDCIQGRCYCADGFCGADCGVPICPNKCSGHGKCSRWGCSCEPGYVGKDCGLNAQFPYKCVTVCDGDCLTKCQKNVMADGTMSSTADTEL